MTQGLKPWATRARWMVQGVWLRRDSPTLAFAKDGAPARATSPPHCSQSSGTLRFIDARRFKRQSPDESTQFVRASVPGPAGAISPDPGRRLQLSAIRLDRLRRSRVAASTTGRSSCPWGCSPGRRERGWARRSGGNAGPDPCRCLAQRTVDRDVRRRRRRPPKANAPAPITPTPMPAPHGLSLPS